MVSEILTYPEAKEVLTKISQPVEEITEEIKTIIQDMKDTLKVSGGVGISAIQLGYPYTICVISHNNSIRTLINPKITRQRGEVQYREGCLSAPGVFKIIPRFQKVWCEYLDENGNKKELEEGGLLSVIIQHEMDHFDGWCKVFDEVKQPISE